MSSSILNDKIKNLTPYEPLLEKCKIRLDANESHIDLSAQIRDEIKKYIETAEFNRYPDPYATELTKTYSELNNISFEKLVAGNGSDELISIIISSFTQKGDKVIVLTPDFSMYKFYAYLAELKVIQLSKDENLEISKDEIISAIKAENPRIVIFSNPCNPTGQGFVRKDVLEMAKSTNALFVVDEAYMDFWDESVADCFNELSNLIVLKTCSKMIGLAALRLGFAVSNSVIINAIKAAKSPYNVNSLSQGIGCIVLKNKDYIKKCRDEILKNKSLLYSRLKELENNDLKVFESRTNFVIIKTKMAKDIFEKLLEKGIAVRCFNGFLRVTSGSAEENEEFLKSFKECL